MFKKILVLIFVFATSMFANGSLVESSKIEKGEVNPLIDFIGTVNFDKNSKIAAQNSGVVKAINFEVGQKVKKGTTLIEIDADLLDAQIVSARASFESSEKDFQRYTKLLEQNSITQKEFDDVRVKYISSKSTLKELEIQKEKKTIKAPFSGVVTEKNVSLGEWVNAGTTLLTLVNTSDLEITFNVPENVFYGLDKKMKYEILVGKTTFEASLIGAVASGDKVTRTFPVKFKVINKDAFVFDGQEAKIALAIDSKKEALIVPRDAVIKRFGQTIIFLIDDKSLAQMVPVKIVGYLGKKIAISSDKLNVGMEIVSKGNERIFPNSLLKVINK